MNMVVQKSTTINVNRFKQTLEGLTGLKYVLKTRSELVHPENKAWYIHIPTGEGSFIHDVYEADDKLVFESPILYDVFQDMESSFSESKYVRLRQMLGDDVKRLQDRSVRERYRKTIPKVCRFFDQVDEVISNVNRKYVMKLYPSNNIGWVTLKLEVETREIDRDESRIKSSVLGMTEAIRLIADWQDQSRTKSIHMGQIARMHRQNSK